MLLSESVARVAVPSSVQGGWLGVAMGTDGSKGYISRSLIDDATESSSSVSASRNTGSTAAVVHVG